MKAILTFPFFYIKEVILGTLLVARDVLSPKPKLSPILLKVPLVPMNPRQRLLLACLISMTPGTLSIDEEDHGRTLIVHSLYGAKDPQAAINHLKNHYESVISTLPI